MRVVLIIDADLKTIDADDLTKEVADHTVKTECVCDVRTCDRMYDTLSRGNATAALQAVNPPDVMVRIYIYICLWKT